VGENTEDIQNDELVENENVLEDCNSISEALGNVDMK